MSIFDRGERKGMTSVAAAGDAAARERIVETAIELFAAKGIDNVSVRELTGHAKVNVGAINYYFGSKAKLAELVFEQLAIRISKRRIDDLERVLRDAAGRSARPDLASVVRAFIRPYVDPAMKTEGALLAQLILQHRLRPTSTTMRLIKKHFDPLAQRFVGALAQCCPEIPRPEFYWRYTFMVSTVVLTVSDLSPRHRLVRLSAGTADPSDAAATEEALVRYLVGAMSAPAQSTPVVP
ncbi:TetR/AcrR family transcriptional regulator [Reyranella sp. CPCC 100927]|uniref:TetR/AcrR family transcriptional regulator n=1 Tax=Reyranella sp. CPCC 100927 TaxID=2599616 RepID=UPI0015B3DD96|nr:TetR/AcrR family transcriptional regulator [Reyranella sp. CPCC 100927]